MEKTYALPQSFQKSLPHKRPHTMYMSHEQLVCSHHTFFKMVRSNVLNDSSETTTSYCRPFKLMCSLDHSSVGIPFIMLFL